MKKGMVARRLLLDKKLREFDISEMSHLNCHSQKKLGFYKYFFKFENLNLLGGRHDLFLQISLSMMWRT